MDGIPWAWVCIRHQQTDTQPYDPARQGDATHLQGNVGLP